MVLLRATAKVLKLLPPPAPAAATSETALGDWYVNRVVVARRPLLMLVSSESLLAILVPARDVRSLPERLPDLVGARLARLGIPSPLIDAELGAMDSVQVAKTADRAVLGILVDFAKSLPFYLGPHAMRLYEAEDALAETPCYVNRPFEGTVFPERRTPELLRAKWRAA